MHSFAFCFDYCIVVEPQPLLASVTTYLDTGAKAKPTGGDDAKGEGAAEAGSGGGGDDEEPEGVSQLSKTKAAAARAKRLVTEDDVVNSSELSLPTFDDALSAEQSQCVCCLVLSAASFDFACSTRGVGAASRRFPAS